MIGHYLPVSGFWLADDTNKAPPGELESDNERMGPVIVPGKMGGEMSKQDH